MAAHSKSTFAGHDCIKLENKTLALWVTRATGPRILGLSLQGGPNLLAELPDLKVDTPEAGTFNFHGGHRLWHAPEDLPRTYIPDDAPPEISHTGDGLLVTSPVEAETGIQKSLAISLSGQEARVVVDHTLQNQGLWPVELAPWAITQLRPGGVAVLPQATGQADEHGLLPNRHIVLWPYTPINSPHIAWGDHYVLVQATMDDGAFKLGWPNTAGWLAYALGDTLFVKHAAYQSEAAYFDRGSSSECYCCPEFIELETIGPRTLLAPGASVTHRETWTVHGGISLGFDETEAAALARKLGLAAKEGPA